MMKFLRKEGVMKKILWVVAVVIILSFGLLSNAYLINKRGKQAAYAGKIFGQKISLKEFDNHFQFTRVQALMQYGDNLKEMLPFLDIIGQTWNRIILLHEAKHQHIRVSDKEVIAEINTIPFFKKDGRFSRALYETTLARYFSMRPRAFEEGIRQILTIRKLSHKITVGVTVSDAEALEAYEKTNERVQVSYILFPADDYTDQVVYDEIKVKDYFITHKNSFERPPAIRVRYLEFPFSANATEDDKSAQYDAAYTALSNLSLEEKPDLDTYGSMHNIPVEESAFLSPNKPELIKDWSFSALQTLFQLKPASLSDILEVKNSYRIAQIVDQRQAYLPSYEEAKDDARLAWVKHEAMSLSRQRAQENLDLITAQLKSDFTKAAQGLGLTVRQTPEFVYGQYLQDIGPAQDFQEAAFSLSDEKPLSDVVETPKGYAVLYLDTKIPADLDAFKEEKAELTQQLLMRKKSRMFQEYTQHLRVKAQLEDLVSKNVK